MAKTLTRCMALALMAGGLMAGPAMAADYPTRTITVVVPYTAGGPTDIAIRSISDKLSQALGQPVVVENVGGAGGNIGTTRAARAAPDGYTLLLHQTGLAIAPALYPGQSVDVVKELTSVGMVNFSYLFLVGNTKIPAKTMPELVAWMKGPGKPAKFAHPGAGSMAHLQTVLLSKALDTEVSLVGYRGGGQAMTDIIGGHADLVLAAPTTSAKLIQAGKVQGYAFAGAKRYPPLADIGTLEEAGYKGLDIQLWQGLFAPAGTPKPIIDRLNAALREALADEKVKATYVRNGVEAFPPEQLSPEFANKLLASEVERWAKAVAEAKITVAN